MFPGRFFPPAERLLNASFHLSLPSVSLCFVNGFLLFVVSFFPSPALHIRRVAALFKCFFAHSVASVAHSLSVDLGAVLLINSGPESVGTDQQRSWECFLYQEGKNKNAAIRYTS